jgi:hypothetical protein
LIFGNRSEDRNHAGARPASTTPRANAVLPAPLYNGDGLRARAARPILPGR